MQCGEAWIEHHTAQKLEQSTQEAREQGLQVEGRSFLRSSVALHSWLPSLTLDMRYAPTPLGLDASVKQASPTRILG